MDGVGKSSRFTLFCLLLILAIGLSFRLLPIICHGEHPVLFMDSDSWEYHRIALNLRFGHGYSVEEQAPYPPNLYRPPGLPLLLLGMYALTGISIPAAIGLQAVISSATVCLTFFLTRAALGRSGIALIAAAIQALDPVAIQYSNLLLTETFTSLLILVVAGCIWRYRSTARARWLAAAGSSLGLGIMMHPVLLFSPLFLPASPLLLSKATRSWRQFGVSLAATVIAFAPASAWIMRNWHVGDLLEISSVSAVNLLKYKAAGVEAELRGTTREIERDRLTSECEAELSPDATPGQQCRLWQRRGISILLAHPLTYAKVHVRGMVLELIGPERDHTTRLLYGSDVLDKDGCYTDSSIAAARRERAEPLKETARYLVLGWQGLLLPALVLGTWHIGRSRPWLLVTLLVIPCYVLALSAGPEASPRFRVLYLPAFSLLTAVGGRELFVRSRTAPRASMRESSAGTPSTERVALAGVHSGDDRSGRNCEPLTFCAQAPAREPGPRRALRTLGSCDPP
jgi:4-amino-4-deoxy-L-arabinose transferase-like glycosyltransferase